ncbi:class I SAM-dependent methyltransferase [Streptomyces chartreusis]|uniref:class I SAM-dependent methyltransferase n=1 Tax=Streptomyces chartreusis TaxID=1969 RepID=UPI0036857ACA
MSRRDPGARVTGIELSPTQHERAAVTHGEVPGVEFVQADVVDYLAQAEPFDAAYAIGTLAFLDPHRALPALRDGLRPGAPLILSLLHTDLHGRSPSTTVEPREQMILLRDDPPLPTQMWVLAPQLWEDLLTEYAFRVEAIDLLHHPDEDSPIVQQLIRARRPPDRPARVSSPPRSARPPVSHAAVGVGASRHQKQWTSWLAPVKAINWTAVSACRAPPGSYGSAQQGQDHWRTRPSRSGRRGRVYRLKLTFSSQYLDD